MLLDAAPGTSCSLEVLDDVAQTAAAGDTVLAQTKSALTDNPVSDRALSLWKTLFNWVQLMKEGLVDPAHTVFEIYVSRPVGGNLINSFHAACTIEAAIAALKQAREEMWGSAPDFPQRPSLSSAIAPYVNAVLATEEPVLAQIIMGLTLRCGSGSPQEDIEAAIRRGPVSDAKVFTIADKLCGWVKRQADKQLERGLPAIVLSDDFHREYVAFVRSVDRDTILKSFAARPSHSEKVEHLPDVFVQQLDLIDLEFDEKLEAVSDFLMSSWDRAMWSKSGDVHEDSFLQLNEKLCRVWRNIAREAKLEAAAKSEKEQGQLLHSRCMSYESTVQGMEPPAHFVPGCFHELADDTSIGWHPTYKTLLKKAGDKR